MVQPLPTLYTTRPYEKGWKGQVAIKYDGRTVPAEILRAGLHGYGHSTVVLSRTATGYDVISWFDDNGASSDTCGKLVIIEPAMELWFVCEKAKPGEWAYGPFADENKAIREMNRRWSTEFWTETFETRRFLQVPKEAV